MVRKLILVSGGFGGSITGGAKNPFEVRILKGGRPITKEFKTFEEAKRFTLSSSKQTRIKDIQVDIPRIAGRTTPKGFRKL